MWMNWFLKVIFYKSKNVILTSDISLLLVFNFYLHSHICGFCIQNSQGES